MKKLLPILLVLFSLSRLFAELPDLKLNDIISQNRVIVDICIYEQQWISPNSEFPKGRLIKRAVVTEVYKGQDVALGAKLEFDAGDEVHPGAFDSFTSPVEGDLRTLFSIRGPISRGLSGKLFFGGDINYVGHDGKATIRPNNFMFPRTYGVWAEAFMVAKQDKSNFTTTRMNVTPPPTED